MEQTKIDKENLIRSAMKARQHAYAPYSHFAVGAALLCRDGSIYTGCNVENASYPASNCAERTALFKAVSEGKREFAALAVVGGRRESKDELPFCMPCGICRQTLSEFSDGSLLILTAKNDKEYREYRLEDLLPHNFSEKELSFF